MAVRSTLGRSLLFAGVLAAAVVPAGAAFADGPHPGGPAPVHTSSTNTSPAHNAPAPAHNVPQPGHGINQQPSHGKPGTHAWSVETVRTRMHDVHLQATTTGRSRVVTTLRRTRSPIQVTCWTRGQRVGGNTQWYRTQSPAGYVAAAAVTKPSRAVPAC
jgi:hypothetical protein